MPSVDTHTWFPEDTRPAVGRQGERLAAVVITATHTLHRTVTSYWKKLAYPDWQGWGSRDRAASFRGRAVNMASASEPKLEMLLKTKKPPWDSAQHGASLPLPAPQAGAPGQPPPPPCLACSDQSSFSRRLAGGLVLTPLLHRTAKKPRDHPAAAGGTVLILQTRVRGSSGEIRLRPHCWPPAPSGSVRLSQLRSRHPTMLKAGKRGLNQAELFKPTILLESTSAHPW